MKLIILAGGQKSTITGDDENVPKPMIDIGGRPLLWHIMKHASICGIKDFIICGGYKTNIIKEYFQNFYIYQSDIAVNTKTNIVHVLKDYTEDWNVLVVDTGITTQPIERVKRVLKYIDDEQFLITYGDCLTDIPLGKLVKEFVDSGKKVAISLAHPSGRKIPIAYELLDGSENHRSEVWTSAGIFIVHKAFFENIVLDGEMEKILQYADKDNIYLYKHDGYWNTIETLRDKTAAEKLWEKDKAPWI